MQRKTNLFTPEQAGEFLQISSREVLRAFRDRRLNGYKLGKKTVRFSQRQIDTYLSKHFHGAR